jgi:hypothetical protein
MFIQNKDVVSEVIDMTLYKYNSIDLKIWGLLNRHHGIKKLSNNSLLISSDVFRDIINRHFYDDINRIEAVGENLVHKEATTIYFAQNILNNILNLRWLKININKNMQYSRVVEIDQIKTIKFNIKTIRGTFRLFDYFNLHQIKYLNEIFLKLNVFKEGEYFKVIKVQDLLSAIDNFLKYSDDSEQTMNLLGQVIQHLDAYESDNPEILLITDTESDI